MAIIYKIEVLHNQFAFELYVSVKIGFIPPGWNPVSCKKNKEIQPNVTGINILYMHLQQVNQSCVCHFLYETWDVTSKYQGD